MNVRTVFKSPGRFIDQIVVADLKHPDHAHLKDWIDGEWDAARFDLDEANAGL